MCCTISIIESGYIMADGGAMFGAIPKRAWMRKYPSREDNLCRLAMRCLLVESGDRKILVDLGMGDKYISEMSYYEPHNLVDVGEVLLSRGIQKEDITDIVLTHLHFDHCGYATSRNSKGHIVPTFSNATYWLSRKQWGSMLDVNPLEKDSIFRDDILPVYDAGRLLLVDEPIEIVSGFRLELYDGHTLGQLVPIIYSGENRIYTFPGDLVPTAAHVSLEWLSAYDICPLTSYTEKQRFLNDVVQEDYILIYCHDSYIKSSKVKRLNDNYIAYKKDTVK